MFSADGGGKERGYVGEVWGLTRLAPRAAIGSQHREQSARRTSSRSLAPRAAGRWRPRWASRLVACRAFAADPRGESSPAPRRAVRREQLGRGCPSTGVVGPGRVALLAAVEPHGDDARRAALARRHVCLADAFHVRAPIARAKCGRVSYAKLPRVPETSSSRSSQLSLFSRVSPAGRLALECVQRSSAAVVQTRRQGSTARRESGQPLQLSRYDNVGAWATRPPAAGADDRRLRQASAW